MNTKTFFSIFIFTVLTYSFIYAQPLIVNHMNTDIGQVSEDAINIAKNQLHVAYGHTSHGSQLVTGMDNLDPFMGGNYIYVWNDGPLAGYLDIDDNFVGGDLGHNGDIEWANSTRNYLDNPNHSDVNVVIWSWCGGVSDNTMEGIQTYLDEMTALEGEYPDVKFVYMTGHLDGSGLDGNLHINNEQIRTYCMNNDKILFDFADIETYDPDDTYFGEKIPDDGCNYDTDDNGTRDGNWAEEWQDSHIEDSDWYSCYCAHSVALNCNRKAYAAWYMWAALAEVATSDKSLGNTIKDEIEINIFPNPSNSKIRISTTSNQVIEYIAIYNQMGQRIMLEDFDSEQVDISKIPSGIYILEAIFEAMTAKKILVIE